ncbi:MAG: hypothetical protein LBP27_05435 [Treponema sp.]|jgi:hypothetical protein|nr:hypothetical protein [Treponema sp.]
MLLERKVPEEKIKPLKVGDYFMDGVITRMWVYNNITTFITSAGTRYNAHKKQEGYNLFRADRYKRKMEAKNLKTPGS